MEDTILVMARYKVALLSDIHGNRNALHAILNDVEKQKINKIIVAGDSTGPIMQNQVFEMLIQKEAIMIRGNGEKRIVRRNRNQIKDSTWNQESYAGNRWVYSDLNPTTQNLLEFLPDQRTVKFKDASPIRVVHGSPRDRVYSQGILPEQTSSDSMRLQKVFKMISIEEAVQGVKESVLVCGHTHRPWTQLVDDLLVVNPGSVGNPCNGDLRSDYAVLSWNGNRWSVIHKAVNYDLETECVSILDSNMFKVAETFAHLTLGCRMSGLDVTLGFLLYVWSLRDEGVLTYDQAYLAASKSFDWSKYEAKT